MEQCIQVVETRGGFGLALVFIRRWQSNDATMEAIVRVPWDDLLSSRQASPQQATPQTMQPQTRLAYTALAGVLIAGLAATNPPNTPNTPNTTSAVPGRNPGEHAD